MKCKIKWFNPKRKFGYVIADNGEEIFIHVSGITKGRNYLGFEADDEVEFDVTDGRKGKPMATNVTLIEEDDCK